ncbi:MAG: ATP synthase subunit I [Thioalkalivibrio sp.]
MALYNSTTRRLLIIQASVAAAGFLLFSLISGPHAAWSALTGGAIGFITTAFFALRVFAGGAERPAKDIVRTFYVGESQKILLTVILFVMVIAWLEVSFLPMFATYMVSLMAFWIVLLPAVSGAKE